MLEEKCTPRYFTVCSRDNASQLREENGSREVVFFEIEEAFNAFGSVYEKSMISTPSRKTRGRRPAPLAKSFLSKLLRWLSLLASCFSTDS